MLNDKGVVPAMRAIGTQEPHPAISQEVQIKKEF